MMDDNYLHLFCCQKLFHVVIDHLIHFSVTDEVFHVFKRDLETVYVNQMMKPGKLNT